MWRQSANHSHFGEHKRLHLESSKQNYYIISLRAIIKAIFTTTPWCLFLPVLVIDEDFFFPFRCVGVRRPLCFSSRQRIPLFLGSTYWKWRVISLSKYTYNALMSIPPSFGNRWCFCCVFFPFFHMASYSLFLSWHLFDEFCFILTFSQLPRCCP